MSDIFKVRNRKGPKLKQPSRVYAKPKDVKKLVKRARLIQLQLAEVKPLYGELEEITMALLQVKDKLAKHGVAIVDKFADKNTQFKTVAITRYELAIKANGGA